MTNFVHQPFTLWATGDRTKAHAGFLAYGVDAPHSVELVFPRHDGSDTAVSFWVDRAMLAAGLQRQVSNGAITVQPHTMADWLVVTLPIDGEVGDFYADAVVVRQFLDATSQLVRMDVAA